MSPEKSFNHVIHQIAMMIPFLGQMKSPDGNGGAATPNLLTRVVISLALAGWLAFMAAGGLIANMIISQQDKVVAGITEIQTCIAAIDANQKSIIHMQEKHDERIEKLEGKSK